MKAIPPYILIDSVRSDQTYAVRPTSILTPSPSWIHLQRFFPETPSSFSFENIKTTLVLDPAPPPPTVLSICRLTIARLRALYLFRYRLPEVLRHPSSGLLGTLVEASRVGAGALASRAIILIPSATM